MDSSTRFRYESGIPPVQAGVNMASTTAQALGTLNQSGTTWHPTVVNLLILIALELAAYTGLRWAFRSFHGG